MAAARLSGGLLGRRSVRARIALACAGLFLLTGAAFVGATYALVDHSLGSGTAADQIGIRTILLYKACPSSKARGTLSNNPALKLACKRAIAGGVRLGAAKERANDLNDLQLWSLVGLGVGTVVAGLLGWVAGRRILLPLHMVTAAARRASQEHLDERITLEGPDDELKELADTFDDMLGRLDLAFASQRRFVANASHELRTPLTSMRTLIDVAMAKPARSTEQLEVLVERVRDALGQSESLIDGLLTLARSDRGLAALEPADLEAAAQDAIDQIGPAARSAGVAVEADLSPAPTEGDRVLLERLAANLLDNGVRYNVPGGSVTVTTGTDDGCSHLVVANTGPLVPETAVASLLEPFTRLGGRGADGRGAGLGLSIVSSVAAAHRGRLEVRASPGGGMVVTVRLPERRAEGAAREPGGGPGALPGAARQPSGP